MEWLTIILAGLLTTLTSTGLVIDQVVAGKLRNQVQDVEVLAVRVDNVPSHQILQGKVNKVRIASRGLEPIDNIRIDTLEIETDPIAIDLDSDFNNLTAVRQGLDKPLQGGIRIGLKEADLNLALTSDNIKSRIQSTIDQLLPDGSPSFKIQEITINFLEDQRIKCQVFLKQINQNDQEVGSLNLEVITGIEVIEGRSLKFVDPQVSLNNRQLSSRFLSRILNGVSENFSLKSLEKQGVTLRILRNNLQDDQLNLALFFRIEPLTDTKSDL
ncbi:MAG: DUF2993 domain-containing protein [Microcystaceae cyanobacterium]